jgi:hypothetical protein
LNADVVPSDLIFSRDDSLRYVLTLGGFAAALHATDLSFAGALPNPGTGGGTSGNTVEWAWAMNAASSVLGSVLAIVIAIHWGLNITLACGAGAYLAAVTLSPVLRPTRVQGLKTVHPESSLTRFTAQWGELEPKAGIGMIFFNHLEIPEHL